MRSGFLGGGIGPRAIGGRAASGNGLLNGLVAYWPLNEAGGANDALDLHGGLTLTQVSSPGSAAGKVYAGARTFDGSGDYFARSGDDAQLSIGNVDCVFAAWVLLGNKDQYRALLGKTRGWATVDLYEYIILFQSSVDRFCVIVSDGTNSATLNADNFGSPGLDEWYLVCVQHDATANTISIGPYASSRM